MAENENETVDRGAYERVLKERDDWKSKAEEKDGLLVKASEALVDVKRRDAARLALKGKVEDADTAADLLTPHLRDVEPDKIAEHIASEGFAPRLAAFKTITPPPEGENGGQPAPAQEPTAGGFGGPSPGNDGTGQTLSPTAANPIKVGSPEYKRLLADPQAYAQAEKDGRIVEPTPAYQVGCPRESE